MTKSPFIDDSDDPEYRARYKFHAQEIYSKQLKAAERAAEAWHDYAKWLLASLLVIHGGAIYAIRSIWVQFSIIENTNFEYLYYAAQAHAGGIVATILTGCIAWINFKLLEKMHTKYTDPAITYRTDKFPQETNKKTDPVNATYYLGIVFSMLSLWMLCTGFVHIFHFLKETMA